MTSKPNKAIRQFLLQFEANPTAAYKRFIAAVHPLHLPDSFWSSLNELFEKCRSCNTPDHHQIIEHMQAYSYFYWLDHSLRHAVAETEKNILAIQPSCEALYAALFVSLEVGEHFNDLGITYNFDVLEAVKKVYTAIAPQLTAPQVHEPTPDLAIACLNAIRFQRDLLLVETGLDGYRWGQLKLGKRADEPGMELTLASEKKENLFVLNELKNQFKRAYLRQQAKPLVSNEEHFQNIDPFYKTQEGLMTTFVSEGITVISQAPGTTHQVVADHFFDDMLVQKEGRLEATDLFLEMSLDQQFHYRLRLNLEEINTPKDALDWHHYQLGFGKNKQISLYQLFCISSALNALAYNLRYIEGLNGISLFWHSFIKACEQVVPSKDSETLFRAALCSYSAHWEAYQEQCPRFTFKPISIDFLYTQMQKVSALKDLSKRDLGCILDTYLIGMERLPILPLVKLGKDYRFPYKTTMTSFSEGSFNRIVFDHLVADALFNNQHLTAQANKNKSTREAQFQRSICDLLQPLTPHVGQELVYPNPRAGFSYSGKGGDIDVAAYFKEENLLFIFQVKLSNTTPIAEKRKQEWIEQRIVKPKNGAVAQLEKDLMLLSTAAGRAYIGEALNCELPDDVVICPFILTDNFFVDHVCYPLQGSNTTATCLSFFELTCLIRDINIHDTQGAWNLHEGGGVGNNLKNRIESNAFWQFLAPIAEKFSRTKATQVVSEAYQLHLRIV